MGFLIHGPWFPLILAGPFCCPAGSPYRVPFPLEFLFTHLPFTPYPPTQASLCLHFLMLLLYLQGFPLSHPSPFGAPHTSCPSSPSLSDHLRHASLSLQVLMGISISCQVTPAPLSFPCDLHVQSLNCSRGMFASL